MVRHLLETKSMVVSSVSFYGTVLSALACLVPPYALRLTRTFGAKKVGWVIFVAFALLAAMQLIRAWHPMGLVLDPVRTLDLLYLLVPVLLLIGMLHIETVFKERLRIEEEEKRMRDGLELQVQERTAQLDSANEELQREISLRKQGEQELRKSKDAYRFLFDENPLPMLIFDLHTLEFLAFNSAALRFYGFSTEEFKALSVVDLCGPGEAEVFLADCARTSVLDQPPRLCRQQRKSGSVAEVEVTAHDLSYAERRARLLLIYDVSSCRDGRCILSDA